MKKAFSWLWTSGIVGNFITGLILVLPLVITVAILGWVGRVLLNFLGPGSALGATMQQLGVRFVAEPLALLVGWSIILVGIWGVGTVASTFGRERMAELLNRVISQIPLFGSVYNSAAQVVRLIGRDKADHLETARVVYCQFGDKSGVGLLGLQVSDQTFRLNGSECVIVYVPTSPLPMSGGIIFAPKESVFPVEMTVDALMQIYLSIGVLASSVVPARYRIAQATLSEEGSPLGPGEKV
jgi:uncharacterized membrane protein